MTDNMVLVCVCGTRLRGKDPRRPLARFLATSYTKYGYCSEPEQLRARLYVVTLHWGRLHSDTRS